MRGSDSERRGRREGGRDWSHNMRLYWTGLELFDNYKVSGVGSLGRWLTHVGKVGGLYMVE